MKNDLEQKVFSLLESIIYGDSHTRLYIHDNALSIIDDDTYISIDLYDISAESSHVRLKDVKRFKKLLKAAQDKEKDLYFSKLRGAGITPESIDDLIWHIIDNGVPRNNRLEYFDYRLNVSDNIITIYHKEYSIRIISKFFSTYMKADKYKVKVKVQKNKAIKAFKAIMQQHSIDTLNKKLEKIKRC